MRTYSLLKNMPVYDQKGSFLGEVCDISITDEGKVTSLIVKRKGFFNKLYRLPIDKVTTFGQHVIVLHEKDQLTKYEEGQNEHTICHFQPVGKIYTVSSCGEELGLLEDVYFQEEAGTIIGYELTDGFFSDLLEGRRVIHSIHPPKFGKDAIIVKVNQLLGGDMSYDEVPELPE